MNTLVVTLDILMNEALQKFNAMNHGVSVHWMAKTPHEQYQADKLSALEAKLTKFQGGKKKQLEAKVDKKKEVNCPSWVGIPPHTGEPEAKTIDGATYYWCKYHAKWSLNANHTSTSCTGCGLTGESKVLFDKEHPVQETPQL